MFLAMQHKVIFTIDKILKNSTLCRPFKKTFGMFIFPIPKKYYLVHKVSHAPVVKMTP